MVESKEKLKSLLMKVKEETEDAGLKLNIQRGWAPNPLLPRPTPLPSTHCGSQQLRRGEERQWSGYLASGRFLAYHGSQAPGSRPLCHQDAQEEGQLCQGGSEGRAQEEICKVVS